MNLLLLKCAIDIDEEMRRDLDRAGHRVIRLGFDPAERPLALPKLLAKLPADFQPDAIVCWSADYNGVPEGIENADALTILHANDYHIAYSGLLPYLRRVDAIWTDALGVEIFRRGGVEHFITAPMYSYAAGLPSIEMPQKDLDLVFIGGLNHEVHQQRSLWLRRMARLGERHKLLIAGGIFGKDYLQQLARAKIVFNHSVRGEMNMRCFEAPMLGCLPMLERANREAPQWFPDGEGHVYYDASDLEDKVAYYLARPEERERIVANARQIAQKMRREQLSQLIAQIEAIAPKARQSRDRKEIEPERRILNEGRARLFSPELPGQNAAVAALTEAVTKDPGSAESFCGLATGELFQAKELSGEARSLKISQAVGHYEAAARVRPRHVPSRLSLAQLAMEAGDSRRARLLYEECLALAQLEEISAEDLAGYLYPFRFDFFRMGAERILLNGHGDPARQRSERALLFRMRAAESLALAHAASGDWEPAIARIHEAYRCSERLDDPDPKLYSHAAFLLWNAGDEESSIAFGERYDQLSPLDLNFWDTHLQRLLSARRFAQAREKALDYARCARGYSPAASKEAALRGILENLASNAGGLQLWEDAIGLRREGKLEEAEGRFRSAQRLCASFAGFALDFGILLLEREKFAEAIRSLDLALEDPATREAAQAYAACARERLARSQSPPASTATIKMP